MILAGWGAVLRHEPHPKGPGHCAQPPCCCPCHRPRPKHCCHASILQLSRPGDCPSVPATCIWERALATQIMSSRFFQLVSLPATILQFHFLKSLHTKGTRARGTPLRCGHRERWHAGGRSSPRSRSMSPRTSKGSQPACGCSAQNLTECPGQQHAGERSDSVILSVLLCAMGHCCICIILQIVWVLSSCTCCDYLASFQ
jgi:hypothetical protein